MDWARPAAEAARRRAATAKRGSEFIAAEFEGDRGASHAHSFAGVPKCNLGTRRKKSDHEHEHEHEDEDEDEIPCPPDPRPPSPVPQPSPRLRLGGPTPDLKPQVLHGLTV